MHMTIASPPGYSFTEQELAEGRAMATDGATVEMFDDPLTAVADADVIYTDVWISMGQEAETTQRLKVFPPFQVNQALVNMAKPDCIVMHCLPAHRGEEITDEVADGSNSVLFQQAENRMHAQKAILVKLMADG
jgi:ornithine carbamoyltransferase